MQLTEINIYPVKSTRRISLSECRVLPRGLEGDRRWMLIDDGNTFVTARNHPRLTLVQGKFTARDLLLTAPGMPALSISLEPAPSATELVTIWRDKCPAVAVGETPDRWFSEYLDFNCRLVFMREGDHRPVNPDYATPGDEVSFADGFPLLLISEGSLADLNSRLEQPASMRRFRPNIVVDARDAFAEDRWQRIRIGDVEFEGVKACSRCVFTTIDPDTGIKDPDLEPLRTLSKYRRRPEGGVFFGQNLIPRGNGTIRTGDQVEVLQQS